MKHILYSTLLLSFLTPYTCNAFSINNAPLAFERRYNANSFILNSKRYYERYTPRQQSLGNEAIEKMKQKKAKKKNGPRLFTQYASEQ